MSARFSSDTSADKDAHSQCTFIALKSDQELYEWQDLIYARSPMLSVRYVQDSTTFFSFVLTLDLQRSYKFRASGCVVSVLHLSSSRLNLARELCSFLVVHVGFDAVSGAFTVSYLGIALQNSC